MLPTCVCIQKGVLSVFRLVLFCFDLGKELNSTFLFVPQSGFFSFHPTLFQRLESSGKLCCHEAQSARRSSLAGFQGATLNERAGPKRSRVWRPCSAPPPSTTRAPPPPAPARSGRTGERGGERGGAGLAEPLPVRAPREARQRS